MRACLLLVLCTVSLAANDFNGQSAYLDENNRYLLQWRFNDVGIEFTVTVNTTGWFGLGFSPNGGMTGADIVTAWVKDGRTFIQDRYAERNGLPMKDISQDLKLISGSESEGVTKVVFQRKHNTCDDRDLPILTDTMRVIWAISSDGQDPQGDDPSYHGSNRGTKSLYLRKHLPLVNLPSDVFTYDMKVENAEIPAFHTRYHCELMKPPKLQQKTHIIRVEPLIQKENLGIVHHIILYACNDDSQSRHKIWNSGKRVFDCYSGNMPPDMTSCRAPITVWGIGGGATDYPAEAGYPVGLSTDPDYYMLEVHYDNPQLLRGRRDNSGIRLHLTRQLRQYDSGIIMTGSINGIAVPPGVKDFQNSAYCTGTCTKKFLPSEGVKVFGSFLHGHLATRQVIARHFRNNVELPVIDSDMHYDFNYQQYKLLKQPVDLKPGDDVMVTCHYNTMGRSRVTYGGLPSHDEMCLSYLYYYPRVDVAECMSSAGWTRRMPEYTSKVFQKSGVYRSPWRNSILEELTNTNAWTADNVQRHEKAYTSFPHSNECTSRKMDDYLTSKENWYTPPIASQKPFTKPSLAAECAAKNPGSIVG